MTKVYVSCDEHGFDMEPMETDATHSEDIAEKAADMIQEFSPLDDGDMFDIDIYDEKKEKIGSFEVEVTLRIAFDIQKVGGEDGEV